MNLALFDFDGTITRHDTWTEFLRFSASRPRILAASVVLSPLIIGYRMGLVSGRFGRPIAARFAFWGKSAGAIRAYGQKYAQEVLPMVLRQRALERIEWHTRQGDHVVVVSSALNVYLTHWCESLGIDVICTELEEQNGR